MTTEKSRETRLRRMAQRQGVVVLKSARRDPLALDYGRYKIMDAETRVVIAGGKLGFASLDEVERWLTTPRRPRR